MSEASPALKYAQAGLELPWLIEDPPTRRCTGAITAQGVEEAHLSSLTSRLDQARHPAIPRMTSIAAVRTAVRDAEVLVPLRGGSIVVYAAEVLLRGRAER